MRFPLRRVAIRLLFVCALLPGVAFAEECRDADGDACGMKTWAAANAQMEQQRRRLAEDLARLDANDARVQALLREVAAEDDAWTRRYRDACYAARLADHAPGADERQLLCFAAALLERVPDLRERHAALRVRIATLPAALPPMPRTCDAMPVIRRGRLAPCIAKAMANRCNDHDACLLTCQSQAKEPPFGGGCGHGCAGIVRMRPELGAPPPGAAYCVAPPRTTPGMRTTR